MKARFQILFLLMVLVVAGNAQAILSSQYTFLDILDAQDLDTPNQAGEDLADTYETSTNFNLLDIKNVYPNQSWRVSVSKADVNWNPNLILSVKRNGTGSACGACMGVNAGASPSTYQTVGNLDASYIFGSGEVDDIPIQFRVSGITVLLPAQTYSTEVTFTLYGD